MQQEAGSPVGDPRWRVANSHNAYLAILEYVSVEIGGVQLPIPAAVCVSSIVVLPAWPREDPADMILPPFFDLFPEESHLVLRSSSVPTALAMFVTVGTRSLCAAPHLAREERCCEREFKGDPI